MTLANVTVLAAFVVIATQIPPRDPAPRRPSVCTEQYAPVCGRHDGRTATYPNACFARAAGATVVADGPCADAPVRRPST